jgi:hypothetical protein
VRLGRAQRALVERALSLGQRRARIWLPEGTFAVEPELLSSSAAVESQPFDAAVAPPRDSKRMRR